MDSLDWSRKFEVLSLSRLYLSSIGFSTEQIHCLTDEDMQSIADGLQEEISKALGGFRPSVRNITVLYLVDKGLRDQTTGGQP